MTMTMPCQRCSKALVDFPEEYCSRCSSLIANEQEATRPKRERAERLDELANLLNRWELPEVPEILKELVSIVQEINQE